MTVVAKRTRVILVEDEALIAEELADRLGRIGYDVISIEGRGEDAVETTLRMRPDLVLMDIQLRGGMDGITATETITRSLDVPIVYLTAHSDEGTLSRVRRTAPFGYVLKPFKEKDLIVAMEVALQRHAIEQQLREKESRWASTLSSIGDGVVVTDAARRVTFLNAVAQELTGWDQDRAEGLPVEQVMALRSADGGLRPGDHPIDLAIRLGKVIRTPGAMTLRRESGATIPIEDSASPIFGKHHEVVGAVMAFRDCTERQRAEKELMEAQDRLREAERLEAVGRLAGGVAHDFNNLLTVILGCSQLLRERLADDAESFELVDDINRAAERASLRTEQLLTFSRKRDLEPAPVDLNELVREVDRLVHYVVGAQSEVHVELSPTPVHAWIDVSSFEQLLINMAANARDAMGPDGGRLDITVEHRESLPVHDRSTDVSKLGWAVLHVSDDGCGMDRPTRERLFEPFFTTKGRNGTGLGLSTVYGTVKQSGGHILVETAEGVGTTFSIYLPVVEATVASGRKSPGLPRTPRGTETILLVDDEPSLRKMARHGLEDYGYRVFDAANAKEAIAVFSEGWGFDLLITDLDMPDIDGHELAQRLRAEAPQLRVLFLTGHTEDELEDYGLPREGVDLLRKPFTPIQLADTVRQLLQRR